MTRCRMTLAAMEKPSVRVTVNVGEPQSELAIVKPLLPTIFSEFLD